MIESETDKAWEENKVKLTEADEKKQEVKDRIQKDEDGQVVVDFGSIDPLSLSKSEMGKLEKSQRLQALNAGIARMMGKS